VSRLADRTVTGVVAGMVLATASATAVGFWLSYAGLHDFALRAGLHGAEAWAWPASVDLFILAGESGVTVSALRRAEDRAAWLYLAIGFAASVTANVLHVDPAALGWTRYAVAAAPPVAAMLALAALLRQVYRLAAADVPGEPEPAPAALNGHASAAAELFGDQLADGRVPSIRAIRSGLSIGQDRASQVQRHLRTLTRAPTAERP
jgi:hypothetical protein